ncbi:hypothetical protein P4284_09765 [Bacillus swezeyi]|uniref:hypothetical protein n=1 Tax=Bacillus swezeyi TaxID=1925020 RepID=UPI002E1ED9A5|nr:hypothetical protein [Bacillus swezeyi]MED2941408.1 hypothetical protein [Bacillus swezeyi]MED2976977.1 hypothetical protein [Bacillus swezeyi]
MRNGVWALYQSKEYEVIQHDQENYELFTKDPDSIQCGFNLDKTGHYCKHVRREEISSVYDVRYQAIINGLEFPIFREENTRLLIGSGLHGPDIIKQYGFVQVDRFEYEKWVEKNEVEKMQEIKIPMWGFPAP